MQGTCVSDSDFMAFAFIVVALGVGHNGWTLDPSSLDSSAPPLFSGSSPWAIPTDLTNAQARFIAPLAAR